MSRADEVTTLHARLAAVGFSEAEMISLTRSLFHRQSHREVAAFAGIQRKSAAMNLYRARKRAARLGIVIPSARRPRQETRATLPMEFAE